MVLRRMGKEGLRELSRRHRGCQGKEHVYEAVRKC